MEFVKGLSQVGRALKRCDDVFLRLNYLYTPVILLALALYVTIVVHFGDYISCWVPAAFTESHLNYANAYCWRTSAYSLPRPGGNQSELPARHRHVAMYFVYMAACFFVPIVLWWAAVGRSGLDVDAVVKEGSQENIQLFVDKFDDYIKKTKSNIMVKCWSHCTTFYGGYLVLVYGIVKLIYIINAIVQLHRVNYYMTVAKIMNGTENLTLDDVGSYASDVAADMMAWGGDGRWSAGKETFPDLVLCDFIIRSFGLNVHRYTAQCLVPVNELNRDVFLVVWFWLCILILINIYGFLSWLIATCRGHLTSIASRGIRSTNGRSTQEAFLMRDGAFLVGLIDQNADKGVAAQVIQALMAQEQEHVDDNDGGKVETIEPSAPPPAFGQYAGAQAEHVPLYPLMQRGEKA